jgi:hypothetical protein
VLVTKWGSAWVIAVYRKPGHTRCSLQFEFSCSLHVIHCSVNRAKVMYQEWYDFCSKHESVSHRPCIQWIFSLLDWLCHNGLGKGAQPSFDGTPLGTTVILCVRGISVKFRQTGNRFSIGTVFKTKHTLHVALMITRSFRDIHGMRQCLSHLLWMQYELFWQNK